MAWFRTPLCAVGLTVLLHGAAAAEDPSYSRAAELHPELHAAMYGFSVCEYCGLVTEEVYDGFRRQVANLIAAGGLSEDVVRKVRIRAWTDADLEWGNRGLGGFRRWCGTEGAAAAQAFVAYREAEIAAETSEEP